MTANEDVSLDAIADKLPAHYFDCSRFDVSHAGQQGRCDCTAVGDILALIAELRSTRASIGPDSERIRELEAENAELRRQLDAAHDLRIEAQNPGIDMDDVRRIRAQVRSESIGATHDYP